LHNLLSIAAPGAEELLDRERTEESIDQPHAS
jgi:hypothetical protein